MWPFGDDDRREFRELFEDMRILKRDVRKILSILQPPTEVLAFQFTGGNQMPLTLPLGDQVQGWITATIDNHDGKGPVAQTALPAGQTLAVVSADPKTFTITLDSPAVPDPDGTATVASFTVVSVTPPGQPNVAINVTATVTNADGSQAAPPLVDTVTVSETATEAIGDIFGTPVVITPPAGGKKK